MSAGRESVNAFKRKAKRGRRTVGGTPLHAAIEAAPGVGESSAPVPDGDDEDVPKANEQAWLASQFRSGKALTATEFRSALARAGTIAADRPLTAPRVPGPPELVHLDQQPASFVGTPVTLHSNDDGSRLGGHPGVANVHKLDLTAGTTPRTHALDPAGHVPSTHPHSSTPFAVRQYDATTPGGAYEAPGQHLAGRVPGEA